MSGIAGCVGTDPFGGDADGAGAVAAMLEAMVHRGDGGSGQWLGNGVVLGFQGRAGADGRTMLPATDADAGLTLVLDGVLFHPTSSGERTRPGPVASGGAQWIMGAWRKGGADCLKRLDGAFALALWDGRKGELVLARDRFGEKPLYYAMQGKSLLFASEVRALLASGQVAGDLNEQALADYLRYGAVHAPGTMVRDIRMLPPGHMLTWADGKTSSSCWWRVEGVADTAAASATPEEARREVRDRFFAAVQRRMADDRPMGAFLSGGIDSSAVVGTMAQFSATPVNTFTITFDEAEFSEARYARIIAAKFGTRHTEVRLKPNDMLGYLPGVMAAMDHPSADGPNTWVASRVVKQAGIGMALSGLGGDEAFAGYPLFKRAGALWRQRWLTAIPAPLRAAAGGLVRMAKPGTAGWKAAELLRLPSWEVARTYPVARLAFNDRQLGQLLAAPLPPNVVAKDVEAILASPAALTLEPLAQVSLAELSTYVPDVLLRDTDQMAMAHGLEVRSPFLDRHLVAFALGVPDKIKYPHTPKQLLTTALGDLLPTEITNRPKMGFTLPWDHWMRDELRDFCESRLTALAKRPQFKAEGVLHLWQRFRQRHRDVPYTQVWTLVVLEEWLTLNGVN